MTYGVYIMFAVSVLTAAVARSIGGLKPGDLLLVLFTVMLAIRRVIRKDWSFTVTAIDTAFLLLIVTGTFFPLAMAVYRHVYISKEVINALAGPMEYYLWYRVVLEALPLPLRLESMMKVIIVVASVISFIGVLQIFHFPFVEQLLLSYFPTYETAESPKIHRATSLVGGWETLAAIASYTILLINQIHTKQQSVDRLGKRWNWYLLGMLAFNVVALLSTLSVAGLLAIVVGYVLAWRYNGKLARATRIALIVAVIAGLALTPYLIQRLNFQFNNPTNTAHHNAVPTTWASRGLHWSIVLATVFASISTVLFGVQPSFAYPVLNFGSTESLYLLLLYRGGIVYLIAFAAFIALVCRYVWQVRQRARGFNQQILTGIMTVLIVNFSIDFLDAHFFSAGEWQILMTLLAVAVGIGLRTDRTIQQPPMDVEEQGTVLRAPVVQLPSKVNTYTKLGLAGVIGCVVLAGGAGIYLNRHLVPPVSPMTIAYYDGTVPTSLENQILGTSAWKLGTGTDTHTIEGYADTPSALPGQTVHLFISTQHQTSYSIDIYRMGWYYGLGGRLYKHISMPTSQAQGYWDGAKLQNCTTCTNDPTTHLVDAHWQSSYTLTIPSDWLTGVYLIKLTAPGGASYIPLVVREDSHTSSPAEILVSLPVLTYQAMNSWGGYSMYGRDTGKGVNPYDEMAGERATAVSFNRPYASDAGAGQLLSYDLHSVLFLERAGFDVSYTTNLDVDADPQSITQHVVFLDLGHDEYWTKGIYDALDRARDAGISLGFFGGGDGYWQARLESDSTGAARRTLVCYKVSTGAIPELDVTNTTNTLAQDPAYAHASTRATTTARWRDPTLNRPENALLGIQFDGFILKDSTVQKGTPYTYLPEWHIRSGAPDALETSVQFASGDSVPGGALGYAYDAPGTNGMAPDNLTILGQSTLVDNQDRLRIADTTYYRTASGSVIFDAGSVWWAWTLDEFSFPGADQPNLKLGEQRLANLTNVIIRVMLGAAHVPPPAAAPVQ